MKDRGVYFGLDFFISVTLIFFCAFLIFAQLNQTIESVSLKQKKLDFLNNGVFLLDSLVKNRNAERPVLGSAFFNSELKRIEQNVLDIDLLKKISPNQSFSGFFLKSVYIEYKDFSKEMIFEKQTKKECMGFERFALIKNGFNVKKGKIVAVICGAE